MAHEAATEILWLRSPAPIYQLTDKPEKARFSPVLRPFGAMYQARYWREREFDTGAKAAAVAKHQAKPLPTLAVAWVPQFGYHVGHMGASRADQLTDTEAAAGYPIESDRKTRLDELTIKYRRGDTGK